MVNADNLEYEFNFFSPLQTKSNPSFIHWSVDNVLIVFTTIVHVYPHYQLYPMFQLYVKIMVLLMNVGNGKLIIVMFAISSMKRMKCNGDIIVIGYSPY